MSLCWSVLTAFELLFTLGGLSKALLGPGNNHPGASGYGDDLAHYSLIFRCAVVCRIKRDNFTSLWRPSGTLLFSFGVLFLV